MSKPEIVCHRRWQRYSPGGRADVELVFQLLEECKYQAGSDPRDAPRKSEPKWEAVGVQRMNVPGGWLVRASENRSLTFVPDSEHTWDSGIVVPDLKYGQLETSSDRWHFVDEKGNKWGFTEAGPI